METIFYDFKMIEISFYRKIFTFINKNFNSILFLQSILCTCKLTPITL